VILAHGFSATIHDMVADRYAEAFQEAGFAALLYDHRSFGISGGEPRCQINKWVQARGYQDAMSFVETLPEIDPNRIALWGDSMSAAVVLVVTAVDPRVKAVVAQVPACGTKPAPPDPDGTLFASLQNTLFNADLSSLPQLTMGPMPVVSFDQLTYPSLLTPLTAYRWFIEYGGRFNTKWENSATRVTPKTAAPFHAGLCAPHLKAPAQLLIAHEDEMPGANPDIAQMVYDLIPEPKELVDLDGGHFGLVHYPSPFFDQGSQAQKEFLLKYL
jgi:alpha-beta hydrolase superfamily lysophospholipase